MRYETIYTVYSNYHSLALIKLRHKFCEKILLKFANIILFLDQKRD